MDSEDEHNGFELADKVNNFPAPRKRRARGKKKKNAPTGFEEYFADAPTTPEEALREQQELYASSVPFEQRIQTCIHRYRTRRRLNAELTIYFAEYMFLGGVDTHTTPFNDDTLEDGSLIPHATTNDDAETNGRFYDGNGRNWSVDFAAVAAGFLSISILPLTGVDPAATERAIGVVESFLRYVLQHDVCPEYDANVRAALEVCARAREEWPRLWRFKSSLPGRFHVAAARTFGVHNDRADWSLPEQDDTAKKLAAEVVFYTSLVVAGEPPKADSGDLRVVRQFTCSLVLRSFEMPDSDTTSYFRRLALGDGARLSLEPLGRAVFRPTDIEDGWVRQVPFEALPADEEFVFLFERNLLDAMTVGMMMTATVCELNSRFRFLKTIETVQPSFYNFLPQHLIRDYKPPRADDRPPPSANNGATASTAVEQGEGAEEGAEEGKDEEEDKD